MKNIILFLFCLVSIPAFSQQVEDTPEIRNWLDNMFKNINKSKIPHGLLRDYAFELADLDIYNGKELNDSNYVNRTALENLLRTIRSSAVGTKPFNAEEVLAEQYSLSGRGKGVMGVVLYQYSYIKEDALTNHLIRHENEQVFDNEINGVWQNPYATGYTLGFSAQDTVFYGSNINYSFPTSIWKSNVTGNKVEFDADDGRGYVSISSGINYQTNYSSSGVKHLKMKVKLADGSYLYSHSLVKVITDNVISTRNAEQVGPDKTVDITATLAYNGVIAKGRISYLYSSNNPGKITRPFIVMEGFDPLEFADEDDPYLGDEKYGSTNLGTFVDGLRKRYTTFTKLRNEYDIIYIDLFDSKLAIQANARLFERAIELINQEKEQSGCTEKNIVIGQSMGGLIARYGLKEMENTSKIHDTSLLFCQDTPHLGAHVPLGILQGVNGLLKFYYDKWIIGRLTLGDFKSKIAPVLYSDAAKQMLINYVDNNGNVENSVHNTWQRELTQMGYPQGDNGYKMRIVSISNGQTPVIDNAGPYIYVDGKVSTTILSDIIMGFIAPNFFASVLGIALQDWQTFALGLLPGSSTIQMHFEAKPMYYPYNRSVCDMYLRYVKKFMWTVKIRRTVFSYQKDYPSLMINYDEMPGSYYQLSAVEGTTINENQAPKWVSYFAKYNIKTEFKDKIMFIPTVSSLDIGEGKVELTTSDYQKKYFMDFPPPSPKHTPFDAYYITDGSTYHTSFEPTMLDWMMEQMKVTIDGPDVATNGSKYAIRNNTKNYAINWSSSDESVATIDNTGTLTMNKYGIITITANCVINNITTKFHKEVLVGFPPFVLEWSIDNHYVVTARCIDPKAEPFLKYLLYDWKLKGDHIPSNGMDWVQSTDPENKTQAMNDTSNKLTVYMRPSNAEGTKGEVLFISIDTTVPYLFSPSGICYVSPEYSSSYYQLEFYPNPLYEDKEVLNNSDQFKIVSIRAVSASLNKYIYFDTPVTDGSIPLKDCFKDHSFEDWHLSHNINRSLSGAVFLINKYNKTVALKMIRCEYRPRL